MIIRSPSPPRGDRGQDTAHGEEPQQDRPVDGVAAERVTELVGEDPSQLLLVEEIHHRGVGHDDRPVQADGHRVERRVGLDVELRDDLGVEGGGCVVQRPMELGNDRSSTRMAEPR
jgi:hypothetical protein